MRKDRISFLRKVKSYWCFKDKIFLIKIMGGYGHKIVSSTPPKIPTRKSTQKPGIKMLTTQQMIQRLLITLAQIKASNTSENLLNEIRPIISLHWAKEIIKKDLTILWIQYTCNAIWKLYSWIQTSKTSNPHKIVLTYKIKLKRRGKYIALSNLSIYYIWKNI